MRFTRTWVSVLFNEPKLLKFPTRASSVGARAGFSALQRAEIAEINLAVWDQYPNHRFSALQRAEIAEITDNPTETTRRSEFQCSSTSRNC